MKKFRIKKYQIYTNKIRNPEGIRFVLLADLHGFSYGRDNAGLIEAIRREKPDAVLSAGDMAVRTCPDTLVTACKLLKELAQYFPVYYALGNHEYKMLLDPERYGMYFPALYRYLMNNGICFLEDETVYLDKGTERIALSGVSIDEVFYNFNHPVMGSGLMEKHLGVADRKMFNLLLAHNPEYFINYAKWCADLTLSGHVHGGIVRIGKAGVLSTNGTPFPKYDGNIYMSKSGKKMIVSRGMGTHTVKVRINNRPELVIVKILAKK